MSVANLITYMEKNMSKFFGVIIIKSPLAPFRLYLSSKAQKIFSFKFECYDLIIGKDPEVENLFGISTGSKVQDLTVKYTKKVNEIELYLKLYKVVKNRSFWFWRSKKRLDL